MKGRMNIGYNPTIYSIIFAQNLRVLDRCMNEDLSLDLNEKGGQMYRQFI